MKCDEVLKKYHRLVSYPLSIKKIKAAGYDPARYLKRLARDIRKCDDVRNDRVAQRFLKAAAVL